MKFVNEQEIPTQLGQEFGGGFFCGYYSLNADGVATHSLIIAPKAARSLEVFAASTSTPAVSTNNDYDGLANTNAMMAVGASEYPAAAHCANYTGGGFTDWYLPSRNEFHAGVRAIRSQSGESNNAYNNTYACPQLLTYNYRIGPTKQPIFYIWANDYQNISYWTSTEVPGIRGNPSTNAYKITLYDGFPSGGYNATKTSNQYVIPFRRVAIPTPFLVPPHGDPV